MTLPAPAAAPPEAPAAFVPAPQPGRTPAGVLVLRVLGLVGLLGLVAAGAGNLVVGFFETGSTTSETITGTVTTLDVDSDVGRVEVRPGTGPEVVVTTLKRWSLREPDVRTEVVGGTATLRGRCRGGLAVFARCSVGFEVRVPAGTTLRLVSSTGSVAVSGMTGRIEARTATGSVELTHLGAPGVDQAVDAEAATGSVVLSFDNPPTTVRARTATGSVVVRVPPDGTAYRVDTQVAVGSRPSVSVPRDAGSSRTIDARTSVGSVVVATTGSQAAG